MQDNLTVSVIIPAYNAQSFIEKAILSVLAQSAVASEIIVVNDGSSDATADILSGYLDRIIYIEQQNAGVSAARNAGISVATSDLIAFLDADDYWHPDKLAIQLEAMQENPHWVACYTRDCSDDSELNQTETESGLTFEDKTIEQIFINPYLTTSTVLVKRELLLSIGLFDTRLLTAEDIDVYYKIASLGMIGFVNRVLVHKKSVENSLGSQLCSYADNLEVIDRFLTTKPARKLEAIAPMIKAKVRLNWARELIWRGQPKAAIPIIKQALSEAPSFAARLLLYKARLKLIFVGSS
ncbi:MULTISPECIES: glycosyltransferase family 2 protein [unclassified Agarivorans]|uniref:glycosyltransferase family 2 protein n=1 Tax=unclassified Agarivorans TaxID=2636026 RepID=UPI003D7C736A